MNVKYICSEKFDFIGGCVSAFICSVYCVFKDLPHWPLWTGKQTECTVISVMGWVLILYQKGIVSFIVDSDSKFYMYCFYQDQTPD